MSKGESDEPIKPFRLTQSERQSLRSDIDADGLEILLNRLPAGSRLEFLLLFMLDPIVDRSEISTDLRIDGELKRVRIIAESDRMKNMRFNDPVLNELLEAVFRRRPKRPRRPT